MKYDIGYPLTPYLKKSRWINGLNMKKDFNVLEENRKIYYTKYIYNLGVTVNKLQ